MYLYVIILAWCIVNCPEIYCQESDKFNWENYQRLLECFTPSINEYPRIREYVSHTPVSATSFPPNMQALSLIYSQWLSRRHPEFDWHAFDTLEPIGESDLQKEDLYLLKRKVILEPALLHEDCGLVFAFKEKMLKTFPSSPDVFLHNAIIVKKALEQCQKRSTFFDINRKKLRMCKLQILTDLGAIKTIWDFKKTALLVAQNKCLSEEPTIDPKISKEYSRILSLKYPDVNWSDYDHFEYLVTNKPFNFSQLKEKIICSDFNPFFSYFKKLAKRDLLHWCRMLRTPPRTYMNELTTVLQTLVRHHSCSFSVESMTDLFGVYMAHYKARQEPGHKVLANVWAALLKGEKKLLQNKLSILFSHGTSEHKRHFTKHFVKLLLEASTPSAFWHAQEIKGINFILSNKALSDVASYWIHHSEHVWFPDTHFRNEGYEYIKKTFSNQKIAPYAPFVENFYAIFYQHPGVLYQISGLIKALFLTDETNLKGIVYEMKLAQHLYQSNKCSITRFLPYWCCDNTSHEYDLLLDDKVLIEAKNIHWPKSHHFYATEDLLNQLQKEAKMAEQLGYAFAVYSNTPVPKFITDKFSDIPFHHVPLISEWDN